MGEAIDVGLTIAESVTRLKRHHWAMYRLHDIMIKRLASMPVYELKMAFSLHSHYCAEHVAEIRTRIREMREPPYGLDKSPSAALDVFFDEILAAPNVESLALGLYGHAFPALRDGLQRHLNDSNRLFDHPTWRRLRVTLMEIEDVCEYGDAVLASLVDDETRASFTDWSALLARCLDAAGGMDGVTSDGKDADVELTRDFSNQPFVFDGTPVRDERFKDSYNMGVNAEAMLYDESLPAEPKTLMMYFKRLREIDVPEVMSAILAQTESGKPWEYTRDMTRQLWDEARHAMMGEIGFVASGVDWTEIPINFTWSRGLNQQLDAQERHAVLFTIEQGLMPAKTGKQFEWETAVAAADPLAQKIQDYDWADEILHARIGRDWIVPEIGSQSEALAFGSACWSRVLGDWQAWKDQGLTEHRNWWPDVYAKACAAKGVEPDAATLAFDQTYQSMRADKKQV